MRKHDGCSKRFYISSQSWWFQSARLPDGVVDEIGIGLDHEDGGTTGEFFIEFVVLNMGVGREKTIVPRLRAFDDSWSALAHMPEFLQFMMENDSKNLSVEQMADGLRELGFKDSTSKEAPGYGKQSGS